MPRQVQKAMIRGVCEKMKTIDRQPEPIWRFEYEPTPGYTPAYQQARSRHLQRNPNALQGGDAKRIIKAKQALCKAQINIALSCSITTPYASKSLGAECRAVKYVMLDRVRVRIKVKQVENSPT